MNNPELPTDLEAPANTESSELGHLQIIEDCLAKNYLYGLLNKTISNSGLTVTKMLGMPNHVHPYLRPPATNYQQDTGLLLFEDLYLFTSAVYKEAEYELAFKSVLSRDYQYDNVVQENFLCVSGMSGKANRAKELKEVILAEAIRHSPLKNKILQFIEPENRPKHILEAIASFEISNSQVRELFLPAVKQEQLRRFVFAIKNFGRHRFPLRYLLNGKPGTGKTQIIRAVINEIKGFATVMFCKGSNVPLRDIFDFCSYFEPCLLILDDIDFIAKDRHSDPFYGKLATFLQALDGLLPNNVFLLASTNDKALVDTAASRPGRFDMILDIGAIEPVHYLSLVKRETDDDGIISFFNEEILNELKDKKVCGAYIVSLVKQLASAKLMNNKLSKDDFFEYLNLSHDGFYSHNDAGLVKAVGF